MARHPIQCSRATGSVRHTLPVAVEAGSWQEFVLTYTAGYFGVDDTGSIKICWRYATDIGTPQFDDPAAAHYVSARASNGAALALRYDPKDNVRPWGRTVQVKVLKGFLREGDRIEVCFGDRSGGGPGIRMQTFCESSFELRVLVDPIATYRFQQVEAVRAVAIVPGPPVRWCALLPTAGVPGTPFRLVAKAEDRWGNPTAADPVRFRVLPSRPVRGLPDTVQIGGGRRAVCLDGLSVDAPGDLAIAFELERSGGGFPFRSNTMVVKPSRGRRRYWGDLHGQSEETIGSGSAEEYFSFARDLAGLDFAGHQGNDFQITGRFWEHLQRLTREVNEPGRFVVFPGYEWSGNTALGGDRNVLFLSEGQQIHRSSHALVDDPDRDTDRTHVSDLFAALRGRPALLIPHVGGRYSDVSFHDRMQRSVEVHSAWGTFEWLLGDALARGQRVGIVCNSDGHKGRPGASYPGASEFGSYGGLTCILAPELTRDALWESLVRRHHYGTTGARIHLEVQAAVDGVRLDDDPRTGEVERTAVRSAVMGDIVATEATELELAISVRGTAPLLSVELRNGMHTVLTLRNYGPGDLGRRLRVRWVGAAVRGRGRQVAWDGTLTVAGNRIERVAGFNFLNPDRQPTLAADGAVRWRSITTGGSAGVDCWLAGTGGRARVITQPLTCEKDLEELGLDERIVPAGGLGMELGFSRLPDKLTACSLDATVRVPLRSDRDDPVYVRVLQEDGHIAWSSPIYTIPPAQAGLRDWRYVTTE